MADREFEVSADPPGSAFHVGGTDHITVTGSNVADTIEFYRDVLGMKLVMRQPNLDQPELTHLFFDTGDGRLLTFFVNEERESNRSPPEPGIGHVHHLAFRIDPGELESVKEGLEAGGHRYSEYDRGAFHSLYTRDNNGLTIELVVEKYDIPTERRGEVLARAHAERVAEGAAYVGDEHLERALEELDIDVERRDVPDAPAGTGVAEE